MHQINYGCKQFKFFIGKIYSFNFSFMSFSKGQCIETVVYCSFMAKVYKTYWP